MLPLFTDVEAMLRAFPDAVGYIGLRGRDLFTLAAANGINKIALNPRSPDSGHLVRREFEALAEGRLPLGDIEVQAETTNVLVGAPSTPPPSDTLAALRESLRAEPFAERAWYFLRLAMPGPPRLCVAVQLREGATPEEQQRRMRSLVQRAGERSPAAGTHLYLVVDARSHAELVPGAAVELYRR